jgi:hypothetical protein
MLHKDRQPAARETNEELAEHCAHLLQEAEKLSARGFVGDENELANAIKGVRKFLNRPSRIQKPFVQLHCMTIERFLRPNQEALEHDSNQYRDVPIESSP